MNKTRLAVSLYVVAVALIALGVLLATLAHTGRPSPGRGALALALAGLMIIAWRFPIQTPRASKKIQIHPYHSVTFAAILLLEPGVAMLLAGAGTALAQIIGRKPWDETLFNSAQVMLQAAVGGMILADAGGNATQLGFDQPGHLLALVVAGGAMYLVNTFAVAIVVGLHSGQAPLRVWYQARIGAGRTAHLAHLAQLGVGAQAAVVFDAQPWALALFLLPAGTIYSALRTEEALGRTEANLAAAQRIARLGSWDWDLQTGQQLWSDEVYRIFGLTPQQSGPTYETLLAAVHPDDRAAVDRAVQETVDEHKPYSIDHRIVLPDGATRVVHQQGEVVVAPDGKSLRMVGTVHDVTERKTLEGQLTHQAFHDPLTGLPNRALFMNRLDRALAQGDRRRGTLAVLFLDLDRFKTINDSLGHEAGDQILVAVAGRLTACLRPGDTAARLGGDEFTMLLEHIRDLGEAAGVAERIKTAMQVPFTLGQHEVFVTTSIGIVLGIPGRDTPADLVRDADVTMYRAKQGGKARYEVFNGSTSTAALERLSLEADLRRALERGEFRVYYQPKVALASERIVGVEALVRWEHPQRGLVSPAEFIPLAEETGLIVPLGRWVLTEACRRGRGWRTADPSDQPLSISVNVSARQFQHPGLVAEVAQVLRERALDPHRLLLEITESVVMEDAESTIVTLQQLKGLGVRLAIDDFGTGYSSLSYLKRLPVDLLKIDRSFVAGLRHNPEDRAIVEAVIAMAHTLGMGVIAEGVETIEQILQLRALHCEMGQGYYFAKPLTGEALDELLLQQRHAPSTPFALAG